MEIYMKIFQEIKKLKNKVIKEKKKKKLNYMKMKIINKKII